MILEKKLVCLRKEKGLSQSELADMMGVSRQAVSRWETGTSVPSSENLKYLRDFYGVSMDYLFNDSEDTPAEQSDLATAPETEQAEPEKVKHKRRPITVKGLLRNAQILLNGLIFLTATYYISKICLNHGMNIVLNEGGSFPTEIVTVSATLITGLILSPAAAAFLHKSEYKKYMLYITVVLAVSLPVTWKLFFSEWRMTHWNLDPDFLILSFTIPGVLSHFAMLYLLLRKHRKSKEKEQSPTKAIKPRLAEFRRSQSEPSK